MVFLSPTWLKCLNVWWCHLFGERCRSIQPVLCPGDGYEYWEVKGDVYAKSQSETWKTSQNLLRNFLCVPFALFSSLDAYQQVTGMQFGWKVRKEKLTCVFQMPFRSSAWDRAKGALIFGGCWALRPLNIVSLWVPQIRHPELQFSLTVWFAG